jgi:hypothetical protein
MRIFLPFVLFLFSYSLTAQDATWFETGTSWKYHYEENPVIIVDPTVISIAEYTITEQTTFNGQACARMGAMGDDDNPLFCNAISAPYYFYESNDSIFFANDYDNTFRLAYDFGAEEGDSWEFSFPVEMDDTVSVYNAVVTEVSTINVDGQELKQMTLQYDAISGQQFAVVAPEVTVTEKLGAHQFFLVHFGPWSICESPFNVELQCYSDNQINYINPNYLSCTVGLNDATLDKDFEIYPNPAFGNFTIENGHNHNGIMRIYSVTGEKVYSGFIQGSKQRISTIDFSPGLYMLAIQTENGNALKKIIVE